MDIPTLSRQVQAARQRVGALERHVSRQPQVDPALLTQALEGLEVAMADLRACEEGLRSEQPGSSGHRHMLKDRFIYNLLHGQIRDEQTIHYEARIFGMELGTPRAVILIDASDFILSPDGGRGETTDAQIRRRAQALIGSVVSFFNLPNDTICTYLGDGALAVLKASNTRNLVSWVSDGETSEQTTSSWANLAALKRASDALREHLCCDTGATVSIGIGRYHPGICQLARSYQDARAALSLGRHFHGHIGVHCLDALGIAAFVGVSDEQTKIDLATYLLSPLNGEPELLATLDAFFVENCVPSASATRLNIHRNTLSYRLDKISALTGLDPRHFDDATQIRLALVLRSLGGGAR
ncbi:MAG: helix-turn-helix domain-containing protein [Chloroflexales bacterium]|nr:helix-turn-helix domain-containing protein [Chloroflexales bacterium]